MMKSGTIAVSLLLALAVRPAHARVIHKVMTAPSAKYCDPSNPSDLGENEMPPLENQAILQRAKSSVAEPHLPRDIKCTPDGKIVTQGGAPSPALANMGWLTVPASAPPRRPPTPLEASLMQQEPLSGPQKALAEQKNSGMRRVMTVSGPAPSRNSILGNAVDDPLMEPQRALAAAPPPAPDSPRVARHARTEPRPRAVAAAAPKPPPLPPIVPAAKPRPVEAMPMLFAVPGLVKPKPESAPVVVDVAPAPAPAPEAPVAVVKKARAKKRAVAKTAEAPLIVAMPIALPGEPETKTPPAPVAQMASVIPTPVRVTPKVVRPAEDETVVSAKPLVLAPALPSGPEVSIILSGNQFYPARIQLREGMRTRLLFTTVNARPAALIMERARVQRWIAGDPVKPRDPRWETNRELAKNKVTEISLEPAAGSYSFHDAITGAEGEIFVEKE